MRGGPRGGTAWSAARSATPPSSTSSRASPSTRWSPRSRRLRRGTAQQQPPVARSWSASSSPRCGTRRARWRSPSWPSPGATAASPASTSPARRRAPAHPPPRRVRVPPARELPLHHPRRGGVRAALDLAGDPVVRADRLGLACGSSTTSSRRGRHRAPRPARGVRPRPAHPSGDVPDLNVQTGAADSIAEHPIGLLTRLRFRVTVNTDNRLMSRTSMTDEMCALVDAFGYTLEDLRWFTINATKSAFLPFDERLALSIGDISQARLRRPVGPEAGGPAAAAAAPAAPRTTAGPSVRAGAGRGRTPAGRRRRPTRAPGRSNTGRPPAPQTRRGTAPRAAAPSGCRRTPGPVAPPRSPPRSGPGARPGPARPAPREDAIAARTGGGQPRRSPRRGQLPRHRPRRRAEGARPRHLQAPGGVHGPGHARASPGPRD